MTKPKRDVYQGMNLIVVPHGRALDQLPKDKNYLTGIVHKIGNVYFYVKIDGRFTVPFRLDNWTSCSKVPARSYTLYETLSDYNRAENTHDKPVNCTLNSIKLPGFYRDSTGDLCIVIGNRRVSCSETHDGLICSTDAIGTDGLFSININKATFTDNETATTWLLSQVRTTAKLL